jgi:hypothetical protein
LKAEDAQTPSDSNLSSAGTETGMYRHSVSPPPDCWYMCSACGSSDRLTKNQLTYNPFISSSNPSRRDTPTSINSLAQLLDPLRTVYADKFIVTVISNVPPETKRKLPEFPFEFQVPERPGIGYCTVASDD